MIELVEAPFPLLAKRAEPEIDVLQRSPDNETSRPPLRIASLLDQARVFEDAQVLRDGWLRQAKGSGEFVHGGFALRQARQDGPPGWVGEGRKRFVESYRSLHRQIEI